MHDVLEKIEKGQYIDVKDIKINTDQRFYILCLAPNAARLSVRFFYQNSFGNILRNFKNHYQRLEVPKPKWAEMEYLGVDDMLKETVNQKSKDKKPVANMAAMVLEAILADSRYPASLYTDTLIRIRAEQGRVTWGRAAIIKAYLIKNCKWEDGETYMETEKNEIAFTLGQLFSVLESIQMDANPGIKSTIRDRYFNAACATPAIIFPILIKLKNSHIRKLERDSSKIYYEKLLTKLIGELPYVPKQLSLEEQGKFILGYYHQTQKKYEKREEK